VIPGFSGPQDLRSLGGGYDLLLVSFVYTSLDGEQYEAPAGNVTDGTSTRLLAGHLNIFPTSAQRNPAGTLHDIHYRTGYVWKDGRKHRVISRKEADQIFAECLQLQNLGFVAFYGYWGLRVFGFLAWRNYRNRERFQS
jgi:hypothetical protein